MAGVVAARRASTEKPAAERAQTLLADESRFDSSREAVTGFAAIYELLVEAVADFPKDCDLDAGQGRCLGLNQAASWSLSFAPAAGQCTQPSIQEARIALLDYVRRSAALDDAHDEPPPLPAIPDC